MELTTTEMATKLVESYTGKLPTFSNCEKINYPVVHQGKLIATMVCNELKRELNRLNENGDLISPAWAKRLKYWDDVIVEIERLLY